MYVNHPCAEQKGGSIDLPKLSTYNSDAVEAQRPAEEPRARLREPLEEDIETEARINPPSRRGSVKPMNDLEMRIEDTVLNNKEFK